MIKIALERVGTNHIAKTMMIRSPRRTIYVFEKDLLGYSPSYPYEECHMEQVQFEYTGREWQGHKVFREI
jgi:hypothetical protein